MKYAPQLLMLCLFLFSLENAFLGFYFLFVLNKEVGKWFVFFSSFLMGLIFPLFFFVYYFPSSGYKTQPSSIPESEILPFRPRIFRGN